MLRVSSSWDTLLSSYSATFQKYNPMHALRNICTDYKRPLIQGFDKLAAYRNGGINDFSNTSNVKNPSLPRDRRGINSLKHKLFKLSAAISP